jgi:hypothetical protein
LPLFLSPAPPMEPPLAFSFSAFSAFSSCRTHSRQCGQQNHVCLCGDVWPVCAHGTRCCRTHRPGSKHTQSTLTSFFFARNARSSSSYCRVRGGGHSTRACPRDTRVARRCQRQCCLTQDLRRHALAAALPAAQVHNTPPWGPSWVPSGASPCPPATVCVRACARTRICAHSCRCQFRWRALWDAACPAHAATCAAADTKHALTSLPTILHCLLPLLRRFAAAAFRRGWAVLRLLLTTDSCNHE